MSKPWGSQGLPSFICSRGVISTGQSSEGCDGLDGSRPELSRCRLQGTKTGAISALPRGGWVWGMESWDRTK